MKKGGCGRPFIIAVHFSCGRGGRRLNQPTYLRGGSPVSLQAFIAALKRCATQNQKRLSACYELADYAFERGTGRGVQLPRHAACEVGLTSGEHAVVHGFGH